MKKIIYYLMIVAMALPMACDDESFTPAQVFLDSPSFAATQDVTALAGGEVVTFSVAVSDAPAGVASISVATTNGLGTVAISENGIVGKNSGEFSVAVTAPLIYEGKFDVTISILDNQIDAKTGDTVNKTFTQTLSVNVAFKFDAPQFTISFDQASLLSGETSGFTVNIADVPGGGIDLIELGSSAGTIAYDQTDVDALIGKSSGILTGVYTAGGETTTGDISVKIRDKTQLRSNEVSEGIATICPSDADFSGSYSFISHGVTRAGVEYRAIEGTVIFVRLNDGQYEVDDKYFGEYDQVRGIDTFTGVMDICGTTLAAGGFSQHEGEVTVDGSDITMIIDWVNNSGDTGFVSLKKL